MENPFKPGDRVRVVDVHNDPSGLLVLYGEYVVRKGGAGDDYDYVYLDGINGGFTPSRFEPVSVDTNGVKYDDGKTQYALLPPNALQRVADVLTYGAVKYPSADNWKRVDNAHDRYLNATMRHVEAYRRGETVDPESGHEHLAHAVCSLLFLLEGFTDD